VRRIDNLLKETIFGATAEIRRRLGADDWCVSVFADNAGVMRFDDRFHACFNAGHRYNAAAPAADFTVTVDWGDGTTSTIPTTDVVAQGNGAFAMLADHTFGAKGLYTLVVRVSEAAQTQTASTQHDDPMAKTRAAAPPFHHALR
jgi:hypothetical protein